MKDDIGALLPLLLTEDSPVFATTADLNRAKVFQKRLEVEVDRLLFRRVFELQAWLAHAKAKVARCTRSADAKTLRRSIARIRKRERLLLGVLMTRRSARAEIRVKPISKTKKL